MLTNQESGEASDAIAFHVLDHFIGAEPFDSIEGYTKTRARAEAGVAQEEGRGTANRDTASKPSLPLAKYAGTYRDPWYGDMMIAW